ncbi:MAG: hypothetical protein BWX80_02457 [Candidatus Hydrogenedentes bacterium ADurb.Bin101]|nr:MAG: hypothetical protein BWX80_02457 [Candidatus Hydrogenedentes bacterium ADurb.Bin101]
MTDMLFTAHGGRLLQFVAGKLNNRPQARIVGRGQKSPATGPKQGMKGLEHVDHLFIVDVFNDFQTVDFVHRPSRIKQFVHQAVHKAYFFRGELGPGKRNRAGVAVHGNNLRAPFREMIGDDAGPAADVHDKVAGRGRQEPVDNQLLGFMPEALNRIAFRKGLILVGAVYGDGITGAPLCIFSVHFVHDSRLFFFSG